MHEGADLFALDEFGEVAGGVHVEDDDGHIAVEWKCFAISCL